jgi:hypothetical protein
MSAKQCRMMWVNWRRRSTPLLVSATWKRRSHMREWAHRYAIARGWHVILTDGSYIRRLMPVGPMRLNERM